MKFLNDLLDQLWTLLGMFIAWVCLEGSAKTVVGITTLVCLGLWMLTFPFRNRDND